jgi:aspartate ammonia-lyase
MPSKVNPVIPEVVNQVCFHVVGNDVTITLAAEAGQLQHQPDAAGHRP